MTHAANARSTAAPQVPALPALRLMLTFKAQDRLVLPAFRGAMWRGVFGRALRQIADAEAGEAWPGDIRPVSFGPWQRDEIYVGLFAPEGEGAFARTPPPFVIDAPGGARSIVEPGQTEMIGLTLIGKAAGALPAVLAAFSIAANEGLGKAQGGARGRAALVEAAVGWRGPKGYQPIWLDGVVSMPEALAPQTPPMPDMVEVTLATPLRLLQGKLPVLADEFHAAMLLEQAVRRVSLLQRLYGPHPAEADFTALFATARRARMLAPQIYQADQVRWSASQEDEIPMDGLVGSFVLPMQGIEDLWPWLWAAQWFHVGKGAAMGMGAIRLRAEGGA